MQNLVESLVSLTKLASNISDNFFGSIFENKIAFLGLAFVNILQQKEDNVAQYQVFLERGVSAIDASLELIKELQYLKMIHATPLLFSVEEKLLKLKLEAVRRKKNPPINIEKTDSISVSSLKMRKNFSEVVRKDKELIGSKKQILDFIKLYPEIRTKDIIYEFNTLSGRTIKRNLTDLLRNGFLRRRVDNKAVYYSVSK